MTNLSDPLRFKIRKLFLDGHKKVEIFYDVLDEALRELHYQDEVWRCVNSTITKVVHKKYPFINFDTSKYLNLIEELIKLKNNKIFELKTSPIAVDILKYNGFSNLEYANGNQDMKFNNPPFDFLGFRNDAPYIIEYKGRKDSFARVSPDQRRRQRRIIKKIDGLNNSCLIQINFKQAKYRLLYDNEIDDLYPDFEIPMDTVIAWIENKI